MTLRFDYPWIRPLFIVFVIFASVLINLACESNQEENYQVQTSSRVKTESKPKKIYFLLHYNEKGDTLQYLESQFKIPCELNQDTWKCYNSEMNIVTDRAKGSIITGRKQ
jgi:hypothetical protein